MFNIFSPKGFMENELCEYTEWIDVNCPLHCHCTFEAVIVTGGEFIIEKEDKIFNLDRNDVMIIMPYEKHSFKTVSHSCIVVFEISTTFISNYDTIFKNKVLEIPCKKLDMSDIDYICRHIKHTDGNIIEINSVFFSLMSAMMTGNRLVNRNEADDIFMEAVLYTSRHYSENICLKNVSEALNVSYVYLSRMFHKKAGIRFNDFLNSFRIQKAATLLCNSSATISEICYSCGFGSLRNFNRVFLKAMNCTPKSFRQKTDKNVMVNKFMFI